MTFKFIAILSFTAVVNAGIIQVPQLLKYQPSPYQQAGSQQHNVISQKTHNAQEQYPDDPHPVYNFEYKVDDAISGDSKSQIESRDGDVVQGEYSLTDADGFRRTVKYTADDINGFNAVVHREPITGHKVVTSDHAAPVHVTPLKTKYYQNVPIAYVNNKPTSKALVAFATPSYKATVNYNAHPEQASQTYISYDASKPEAHTSHYHQ